MSNDSPPPDTDAMAEAVRQLARAGAPLGELLECAKQASGGRVVLAVKAFIDAFDLPIADAKLLVGSWDGFLGHGYHSDELERDHGARVRSLLRPCVRKTRWTRSPDGGWHGSHEE